MSGCLSVNLSQLVGKEILNVSMLQKYGNIKIDELLFSLFPAHSSCASLNHWKLIFFYIYKTIPIFYSFLIKTGVVKSEYFFRKSQLFQLKMTTFSV